MVSGHSFQSAVLAINIFLHARRLFRVALLLPAELVDNPECYRNVYYPTLFLQLVSPSNKMRLTSHERLQLRWHAAASWTSWLTCRLEFAFNETSVLRSAGVPHARCLFATAPRRRRFSFNQRGTQFRFAHVFLPEKSPGESKRYMRRSPVSDQPFRSWADRVVCPNENESIPFPRPNGCAVFVLFCRQYNAGYT